MEVEDHESLQSVAASVQHGSVPSPLLQGPWEPPHEGASDSWRRRERTHGVAIPADS